MFRFEQFEGWQRAIRFGRAVYKMSGRFPQVYQFSLGEQLRRASLSISANLAEGSGRDTLRDRSRFYHIAKGSLYECISLLVMAKEEGLLTEEMYRRFYERNERNFRHHRCCNCYHATTNNAGDREQKTGTT